MSSRHLHRLLTGIYLEIRQTRQYVEFLHQKLVEHEIGKEAKLPSPEETKKKAKEVRAKAQKKKDDEESRFLAQRAKEGIGNGGLDLTPEEQRAYARGEAITMGDD